MHFIQINEASVSIRDGFQKHNKSYSPHTFKQLCKSM